MLYTTQSTVATAAWFGPQPGAKSGLSLHRGWLLVTSVVVGLLELECRSHWRKMLAVASYT